VLHIKALVAALEGRPQDVADAMQDTTALAESLRDEPILISQLRRTHMHHQSVWGLRDAMSRTVFTDPDLARFDAVLAAALPPVSDNSMFSQAFLFETLYSANLLERGLSSADSTMSADFDGYFERRHSTQAVMEAAMLVPAFATGEAQSVDQLSVHTYFFFRDTYRQAFPKGATLPDTHEATRQLDRYVEGLLFHSPLLSIVMPAISRAQISEWRLRTQFDVARAAIAVERYRLANGRLPDNLNALVPQYLDRVPLDPFNEAKPVTYRVGNDGGFVVYSYGLDWRDDYNDLKSENEDIRFEVPPLQLRTRPQIAQQ
jgi:hypothetical protein